MPFKNPKCLKGYELLKSKCKCRKIKKKKTVKKKTIKKKTVKKKTVKKKRVKKKAVKNKTVKCSMQKKRECKALGKVCNPLTGRCKNKTQKKSKIKAKIVKSKVINKKVMKSKKQIKRPTKKIMTIQLSPLQEKMVSKKRGKSYSPMANLELESYNKNKNFQFVKLMNVLYNCKDKLKVNVDGKCVDYKNKKAQQQMLQLLNYKSPNAIIADLVIAPAQVLSNCWLNSFFMCYFISDKGRKFFRSLRRVMITGEKKRGGSKITNKYRKGLWLLNKMIQASLFYSDTSANFIKHADTNDVIRLLRGKGEGKQKLIVKTKEAYNPMQFYNILFNDILNINSSGKLVKAVKVNSKQQYNLIFKQKNLKERQYELITIERRDDASNLEISSKTDKVPKEFKIGRTKYVLDSAVLRSIDKKHFTSYITLNGKEYAFEGGAYRRLRKMDGWKDLLTKNTNKTWKFGTPLREDKISQRKEGYLLNEEFNFTKGYQMLFYYRQ